MEKIELKDEVGNWLGEAVRKGTEAWTLRWPEGEMRYHGTRARAEKRLRSMVALTQRP